MAFAYNRNYQIRDNILNIATVWDDDDDDGEIFEFEDMNFCTLQQLIDARFIDPHATQNNSPSNEQFALFLGKHPAARATGYAVSPLREDYRVSLTGIIVEQEDVTEELSADFDNFSKTADEIIRDGCLYCWWD